MKRFTVITALFSVSILALWVAFDAFAAPPSEAKRDNSPVEIQNVAREMQNAHQSGDVAVPVTGRDMKIAPVFDITGAVVSDPTGTILSVIRSGDMAVLVTVANMKIAPVFDTTGAVVSDPTGTMLKANRSGASAVPVMGLNSKIAPVFDNTGVIVSDPSGTILSVINP